MATPSETVPLAGTMQQPPAINKYYEASPCTQLAVLKLLRPHVGAHVEDGDGPASPGHRRDIETKARSVPTHGIDVFLVLLRQFISFGLQIEDDDGEPLVKMSEAETEVWRLAQTNLGWDRLQDYNIKGMILKLLYPKTPPAELISVATAKPLTFEDVSAFLPNLIKEHASFQFYFDYSFIRQELDGSRWNPTYNSLYMPPSLFMLTWDGVQKLELVVEESILRRSEKGAQILTYSRVPPNLCVRYTPAGPKYTKFKDIRHLNLSLTTGFFENNEWQPRRRRVDYILAAVIRLTGEENRDDIRIYWNDGHEIVPAPVGLIQDKDAEASKSPRWTVEGPGTFNLYYWRMCRGENWVDEGLGIDHDAPEFEKRDPANDEESSDKEEDTTVIPSSSVPGPTSTIPTSSSPMASSLVQKSSSTTKTAPQQPSSQGTQVVESAPKNTSVSQGVKSHKPDRSSREGQNLLPKSGGGNFLRLQGSKAPHSNQISTSKQPSALPAPAPKRTVADTENPDPTNKRPHVEVPVRDKNTRG